MAKKPFLRAALFCTAIKGIGPEDGGSATGWTLENVTDTIDATGDVQGVSSQLVQPFYLEICPQGLKGEHTVRLRFVDESDRYLPGEGVFPFRASGDEDTWRVTTRPVLELDPLRSGLFRLLIELDGSLLGWAPLRVIATKTIHGES